jgi:hypothetical protein
MQALSTHAASVALLDYARDAGSPQRITISVEVRHPRGLDVRQLVDALEGVTGVHSVHVHDALGHAA